MARKAHKKTAALAALKSLRVAYHRAQVGDFAAVQYTPPTGKRALALFATDPNAGRWQLARVVKTTKTTGRIMEVELAPGARPIKLTERACTRVLCEYAPKIDYNAMHGEQRTYATWEDMRDDIEERARRNADQGLAVDGSARAGGDVLTGSAERSSDDAAPGAAR